MRSIFNICYLFSIFGFTSNFDTVNSINKKITVFRVFNIMLITDLIAEKDKTIKELEKTVDETQHRVDDTIQSLNDEVNEKLQQNEEYKKLLATVKELEKDGE